jgi:large subunit ribosomal protein L4
MKIKLHTKDGKELKDTIELDKNVFEVAPNEHCLYLVVKAELAAKRQGTSSSKSKSEVSGTGAKPWKQKGTGRARVGRIRNPSRVHGGTAFGPEPRSYNLKINKKVRRIARISALSTKCISNNIVVLDSFDLKESKTKQIDNIIKSLKLENKKITFITEDANENFFLSCRNLKNINLYKVQDVTVYQLMNSNVLVFDPQAVNYFNNKYKN